MIAAPISSGIDLGGTKIEAQVFAPDWSLTARNRWPTPKDYPALVAALVEAIRWCETHGPAPIGISAAGLVNPRTGLALTSNLSATGKPFPADIAKAANRKIAWINDCRALTLSEAMLGAARGADPAVGLILGTGVAGGVVTGGKLLPSPSQTGGEFGHFPLAAPPVTAHNLPILTCGCGRLGCVETYLSAPGLARIAAHLTGVTHVPETIVQDRATTPAFQMAWDIWLDLATEFLVTLCLTIDPQVIILGGGLSRAPGLTDDLAKHLTRASLGGFPIPAIRLAEGGDASGARGAALHALNEARMEAAHA